MYKQDFPIFKHNPELAYLDNAATTHKPQVVIDKINQFYTQQNANVHRGLYKLSEQATIDYENARQTVAKFIGAKAQEIIFTSGTTDSLNKLAYMIEGYLNKDGYETILATQMEHHSNLLPWQQLAKRSNAQFKLVELSKKLRLNYKNLHSLLQKNNVKVLALTHMSNTLGVINDLAQIIPVIRKLSPQTLIVIDGAQAIAHLPINCMELDVDFYAFSGHKIFAPTGIGVLYGKNYLLEHLQPAFFGGGMINTVNSEQATWSEHPTKFEAGTPNISGAIVLASAIDYINHIGYQKIAEYEQQLTSYFLQKIAELDFLNLHGPNDLLLRGPVFTLTMDKIHPHDIAQVLSEHTVAVRAGHHCNQILMRDVLGVNASLRVSLSIYNTTNDIDQLIAALKNVYNKFS